MKLLIPFFCGLLGIASYGQPDWEVDNALYNLDGNIVVSLSIFGELSTDANDRVAAFDEQGNCRGVCSINYNSISDSYIGYLTVVGSKYGEKLTFKVYDASENIVFLTENTPINFVSNLDLGDIIYPFLIESSNQDILQVDNVDVFDITCSPNPVSNHLVLTSNVNIDPLKISIFDTKGVLTELHYSAKNVIDMSGFIPGVYYVQIQSSIGNITKKIIKE